VFVETPADSPERIDAAVQRHLYDSIRRAGELGAEVVRLKGQDVVAALLEFAQSHRVAHILIGRSHDTGPLRFLRRSTMARLVDAADGFDLHIVAFDDA